jgi:hypothetical protein
MIYTATIGTKWRLEPFDTIPLRVDHTSGYLPAVVTFVDSMTVRIYTDLEYNVGQFVSISGYPISGRRFKAIELSITDYPVLAGAQIIEKVIE